MKSIHPLLRRPQFSKVPAIRSVAAILLVVPFVLSTPADAATILTSDFDGNTLAGGGAMATVTWAGDESSAASSLAAIGPGSSVFGVEGNGLSTGNTIYLDHNLNISPRSDLRGYSFTFTPEFLLRPDRSLRHCRARHRQRGRAGLYL